MVSILAVTHQPECPLGTLGAVWEGLGCCVRVVEAWHQPVPESLVNTDALVVMGGVQNCLDDHVWPWLPSVRRLIRTTVSRGTPFLGVCLGHQLATVALGGRVRRSDHLTMGLTPVGLSETGCDDPLMSGLAGCEVVHFNNDIASRLPPGARLLAADPTGQPQAVRFADRAWGVQFHPEANRAIFDGWIGLASKDGWRERTPWETAQEASRRVGDAESSLHSVAAELGRRFAHLVETSSNSRVA